MLSGGLTVFDSDVVGTHPFKRFVGLVFTVIVVNCQCCFGGSVEAWCGFNWVQEQLTESGCLSLEDLKPSVDE